MGLTVSDVRGTGKTNGVTHVFRGSQYATNLSARVKIEIIVEDEEADRVADAILRSAQTGEVGVGKILMYRVDTLIRIRTAEKDDAALR